MARGLEVESTSVSRVTYLATDTKKPVKTFSILAERMVFTGCPTFVGTKLVNRCLSLILVKDFGQCMRLSYSRQGKTLVPSSKLPSCGLSSESADEISVTRLFAAQKNAPPRGKRDSAKEIRLCRSMRLPHHHCKRLAILQP